MAKAQVRTKKDAVEAALLADLCKLGYSGLLALERSDVLIKDYDPKAFFIHPRYAEPSFFYSVASGPQPLWLDPAARNAKPDAKKR